MLNDQPLSPGEARAYIAVFRVHTLPGASFVQTNTRTIHFDSMTDADAVFLAREFQRMEAAAARGARRN